MFDARKTANEIIDYIRDYYKRNIPICIASKGIEETTGNFLSNIVKKVFLRT